MSGGTFDYDQHKILNIIDKINESDPIGRCYSEDTIQEFNKAIRVLNDAYTYAHRIDWCEMHSNTQQRTPKRMARHPNQKLVLRRVEFVI